MILHFFCNRNGSFSIDSGNLKSLKSASLNLGANLHEEFQEKGLVQLLESISYVRTLEIDIAIIQALYMQNMHIAFNNLQHLVVNVDKLQHHHIAEIASFLEGLRLDLDNLRTLVKVKLNLLNLRWVVEFSKHQSLSPLYDRFIRIHVFCFLQFVKSLKM
ncbi:hypothetical protein P3X46_018218 [Hevea brasiliensis]|uniref:Uncharacterized protein n=1 Tax=Hevea brasiliensis TaxID=3981 RepID=A0ABQ9LQ35_HEVBR|nr:hypothetical protein P3X46_018218 [Hevea brasiliensis]